MSRERCSISRRYPKHPLPGVGALIFRRSSILLVQRARNPLKDYWSLPGGLIETGETIEAALMREVLEETGLRVTALYTAGSLDSFYDPVADRIVMVPFFVARVEDGEVQPDGAHDQHRWSSFAEAADLLTFVAQRRLLDDVRASFVEREPEAWRTIP